MLKTMKEMLSRWGTHLTEVMTIKTQNSEGWASPTWTTWIQKLWVHRCNTRRCTRTSNRSKTMLKSKERVLLMLVKTCPTIPSSSFSTNKQAWASKPARRREQMCRTSSRSNTSKTTILTSHKSSKVTSKKFWVMTTKAAKWKLSTKKVSPTKKVTVLERSDFKTNSKMIIVGMNKFAKEVWWLTSSSSERTSAERKWWWTSLCGKEGKPTQQKNYLPYQLEAKFKSRVMMKIGRNQAMQPTFWIRF